MSDHDLRALERQASTGDLLAARQLAITRFRLFGDCRTGLCGNRAARVRNDSVNNRALTLPACPTCRLAGLKEEALALAIKFTSTKHTRGSGRTWTLARRKRLTSWLEDEAPWRLQRDENVDDPALEDRLWLEFVEKLEEKCLGFVVVAEDGYRVRYGEPPENAIPQKIWIANRSRFNPTCWVILKRTNDDYMKMPRGVRGMGPYPSI